MTRRKQRAARGVLVGWAVGTVALCAAQPIQAQARWGLGRWQGEGNFLLDWEKQNDESAQNRYETLLFQERLALRNVGAFIVDPRFLTLNLGGSFGLSQEDAIEVHDTSLRVGDGTLYDYAFDGLFFSDSVHPVTLFANRNQNTLSQGFGGRSDVTFETHGGVFELREGSRLEDYGLLNFSSLLDVRQELLEEDSSVFGSPFRRDERHNIVRYRAHKGGETSDLDLRYELNDVNDPLNPTNVFDSHTVRAVHSLDFGPTLNRRVDSIVYYFNRSGTAPGSYVSVDEGLHLDHHSDLATDYRYSFSQSDSTVGLTATHTGSASLLHRLYRQLTTTLDARGTWQNLPTGERTMYGGRGGFGYNRPLVWRGQLFAALHGGYQIDDNNFTSSQVDVVDERHTAPPVLGAGAGFTLDNPFVLTETIVMVDVRGGSRLATALNVDYVLSQEGSLTKIIPLPGSPVIRPNDPLEVSYAFAVDPSIRYSTANVTTLISVEFPWVAASYEHALSDQTRLAGTASPQFLIDQNTDRFTLELRRQWSAIRAQAGVEYEILRSTIVDTNTLRFDQLLAYQPRPDLIAQLTADQYLVDYPGQARHTDSYLVRGTIDWVTPLGFSVSTFSGYRAFRDTSIPNDEIIDVGFRILWTYQRLTVAPAITWSDYRNRLTDLRGELRITRSLF